MQAVAAGDVADAGADDDAAVEAAGTGGAGDLFL